TLVDPSGYSWLSKLFRGIGKIFKYALAIAGVIFAPVLLIVGAQILVAGNIGLGLGLMAGGGLGLALARDLKLPAWANEVLNVGLAIVTAGASTISDIASTIAHHVEQYFIRRELGRILRKSGLSLAEIDAALLLLSIGGEQIGDGRLHVRSDGGVTIDGVLSRHWYALPFDVIDIVLAYQGLPTGASLRYMLFYRGDPLVAHSLGTLDAANLVALGFAKHAELYSVPLGMIAPMRAGTVVTNSVGDAVNGFFLGWIFNPSAANSGGSFLAHRQCRDAAGYFHRYCPG
ncbi:MAG: hypothetical protein U1F25_00300, partial [Rubrivivax sp.]